MAKIFEKGLFATRLASLMAEHDETTYSLAAYLHMSPSAISRYTTGDSTPKLPTIQMLAEKFGVNPVWLMGAQAAPKHLETQPRLKRVPVLGEIAAGQPLFADEHVIGYEAVPETSPVDFCLLVRGDSMINARILDGDIVYIHQQPTVENGEIAAVMIDDEVTLKRFYFTNGSVILHPENPMYKDMVFSKKDMKHIRILGKALRFRSEVR